MRHTYFVVVNSLRNFNPRTHVGCDIYLICTEFVSELFQSTHPRGVRLSLFFSINQTCQNFNPRTHVGCDEVGLLVVMVIDISIHAPTWGATHCPLCNSIHLRYFNPRTHVGCDVQTINTFLTTCDFNPRTHVGCDIVFFINQQTCQNFNPRTHVGCDIYCLDIFSGKSISIHAPTWGATILKQIRCKLSKISIHAPTWGATQMLSRVMGV